MRLIALFLLFLCTISTANAQTSSQKFLIQKELTPTTGLPTQYKNSTSTKALQTNAITKPKIKAIQQHPKPSYLEKKLEPSSLNRLTLTKEPLYIQQFGYNQLYADQFKFDPIANPALPGNYKLGPGDQVVVFDSLSQLPPQTLTVDGNGMLFIPGLRPISIWDNSLNQVNKKLRRKKKSLQISLGRVRSIQVNIIGQAVKSGLHQVPAIASIYNILALSGGIKKTGSLRYIEWKRNNKLIATIDLYDYLMKGKTIKAHHMKSGDTLFIPLLKKAISISGEVIRPGIYEIKEEKDIQSVLSLAGGFLPTANPEQLVIERVDLTERKVIRTIEISDLKGKEDFGLQKFDILIVKPIVNIHKRKKIKILGEIIQRPGEYYLVQGESIKDLIAKAGGLKSVALDPNIMIHRWTLGAGASFKRIILNKKLDLKNYTLEGAFILQDEDSVFFRQYDEYEILNFVTLKGEVKYPGMYEFSKGDALSDIIKLAGGFTEDADIKGMVFIRKSLIRHQKLAEEKIKQDEDSSITKATVNASSSLTSPETQFLSIKEIKKDKQEKYLARQALERDTKFAHHLSRIRGRILLDIEDPENFKHSNSDIVLINEDEIMIPRKLNTVMVMGETKHEASFIYKEGNTVQDYLNMQGELNSLAKQDLIYVVQTSGIIVNDIDGWFAYQVQPGDTIMIPPDIAPKESVVKGTATIVDVIFKALGSIMLMVTLSTI